MGICRAIVAVLTTACLAASLSAQAGPMIASGERHSLILAGDKTLWSFGAGSKGQLGNGVADTSSTPARVMGGVLSIASGAYHSLAIDTAGKLWGWGDNQQGQLGALPALVVAPAQLPGIPAIRSVAAGGYHTLAVDTSGGGWAWGDNTYGQLGDGKLIDCRATPALISGLPALNQLAGGGNHTLALDTGGNVWAWGSNANGQIALPSYTPRNATLVPQRVAGISNATAIAGGGFHSLALKADGTVWSWGDNTYGQLGDGTRTARYKPGMVANLADIVAIGAGRTQNLAIDSQGNVWAWGQGDYWMPGAASGGDSSIPGKVGVKSGLALSSGAMAMHRVLLSQDGTVWAWGMNDSGQLGDGTYSPRQLPVLVVNETADGPLDLIPEVANSIPADKIPPLLLAASKSGDLSATTLSALLKGGAPANLFAAGYNVYVAAMTAGQLSGWWQLDMNRNWSNLTWPMAAFVTGVALDSQGTLVKAEILHNADLSQLRGSVIYLGYGTDADEMLRAGRYRDIFTVPSK